MKHFLFVCFLLMFAMLCNMAHAMSQGLLGTTLRLFRHWILPFSWLKFISLCGLALELHCNWSGVWVREWGHKTPISKQDPVVITRIMEKRSSVRISISVCNTVSLIFIIFLTMCINVNLWKFMHRIMHKTLAILLSHWFVIWNLVTHYLLSQLPFLKTDITLLIWNIKKCKSNLASHLDCKPPFCSQNPFIEALMRTCVQSGTNHVN